MIYGKTDGLCIKQLSVDRKNRDGTVYLEEAGYRKCFFFLIYILFRMGEKLVHLLWDRVKNAVERKNNSWVTKDMGRVESRAGIDNLNLERIHGTSSS